MNKITKITIALCEGPHDTAFLYRILKTRCFKRFGDELDNLPKVVGEFIIKNNKMAEYSKLKIGRLHNEFVPSILYKNENLILLYAMGGDKKTEERLVVLRHFFNNIESEVKDNSNYGKSFISTDKQEHVYYNFLFFYDADADKNAKIKMINDDLKKMDIEEELNHNKIIEKNGYSIGAYIFSNKDDTGALEDILFELMKKDNEQIFDEAENYYKKYLNKDNHMKDISRTKRLVTECIDGVPKDKRKDRKQEDEKKSIICIAGQLQKKGKSNTVIIEDSDYLNLEKIQSSQQLQEIADLFDK